MAKFDGPRPQGHPCWLDLTVPDAKAAAAFYESIAGIAQRTEAGAPSHWSPYLMVEDADTAATSVRDEGGGVLDGPFDSEYGRIFEASDPFGATFKVLGRPTS